MNFNDFAKTNKVWGYKLLETSKTNDKVIILVGIIPNSVYFKIKDTDITILYFNEILSKPELLTEAVNKLHRIPTQSTIAFQGFLSTLKDMNMVCDYKKHPKTGKLRIKPVPNNYEIIDLSV